MLLPTLGPLVDASRRTAQRFPLVLAAGVASAGAGMGLADGLGDETQYLRLLAATTLGLPLLFALTFVAERRAPTPAVRWAIPAAGVIALVLFWARWPAWSEEVQAERYFQLSAAFHLLVAFAPYAGFHEPNGFWYYNKALFLRFLTAALYSGVLWAGLAVAFAALDKLLGVEVAPQGYARLWMVMAFVFNTWFFVGGVPDDLPALETRRDYPAGLRVFTQYVLLPIVVIYLAILTLYLAKVVVTRQWPSGWIGYLVSSVAVVGILSWLLVRPLEEQAEHAWVRTYTRGFYLAIMPAIVMLWLAIWKRVEQYGITERRYFLIMLSLWLAGIAVYYTVRRSRSIALIPATLCALGLLTFAGPWGAYAVSRRSQAGRLEALLTRNGVLSQGVVHRAEREVPLDDRKEISAALDYLISTHGASALPPWLRDSMASAGARGSVRLGRNATQARARAVMATLAIPYVVPGDRGTGAEGFSYSSGRFEQAIPISGYQYAVRLSGRILTDSLPIAEGAFLKLDRRANALSLTRNGQPVLEAPLRPAIDQALAWQRSPARGRRQPLRVEARNTRAALLAVLTSFYGRVTPDSTTVRGLDGEVFVRLR